MARLMLGLEPVRDFQILCSQNSTYYDKTASQRQEDFYGSWGFWLARFRTFITAPCLPERHMFRLAGKSPSTEVFRQLSTRNRGP